MILVIGSMIVQDAGLETALELALEHVRRSRVEPGCVSHAVHQDAENPHRLVFVEEWEDAAALAQHFAVPASQSFVRSLAALGAEPPSMMVYDVQPRAM